MSDKSVLCFYSFPSHLADELASSDYADIWQRYVTSKLDGVACLNIFGFKLNVEDLKATIDSPKTVSSELLNDIQTEHENGATYMFVAPEVGTPICGYHISKFLNDAS